MINSFLLQCKAELTLIQLPFKVTGNQQLAVHFSHRHFSEQLWIPIPGSSDFSQDIPTSHLTYPVIYIRKQMDQMALLKICCICLTTIGFPKGTSFCVSSVLLHSCSSTTDFCSRLHIDCSKNGGKEFKKDVNT